MIENLNYIKEFGMEEFLNKDATVALLMEFANEFVVDAHLADTQARITTWILSKVK